MNKEIFGAFIAENRREKEMTQQQLADRLHVTDKAVSKWERGLCYPDLTLMEELAAALDLTVTELMACQRQTEEPSEKEDAAVHTLLDISGSALKHQRKTIWLRAVAALLLVLALAGGALYRAVSVSALRQDTVTMKQMEGNDCFIFLGEGNRLLRLHCPDREAYDAITIDGESLYDIQYRWNRLTYEGTVEHCTPVERTVSLGGVMNMIGSCIDLGSVLGIDCVWQEYRNIYPDPAREGGWLFTYRLWYNGDGSDYWAEGEERTLITVENCRSICADDYDKDGVAELFVFTRYDENPYMVYDLEDGAVSAAFLPEVPARVEEFFQLDTAWY